MIVIPTRLDRPTVWPLIEEARQVGPVVIVHTTDTPDVPDTITVRSTARNIHTWWNAGLDLCGDKALVLNDDIIATASMLQMLVDALDDHDLVSCAVWGGTSSASGFCFGIRPEVIRPDESYTWFYGDDDLWLRAHQQGLRVGAVPVPVVHVDEYKPTMYPEEFTDAVWADRQLFADRWRSGDTTGLPA